MGEVPRHDIPHGGRSGFTRVEGRQVHYLEWGGGDRPGVLALHGGGQTAYMYEALGDTLAGRAHVLAPDLPAHGDSDPLPDDAATGGGDQWDGVPWPMHRAFALTMEPLLDAFGMGRVLVVGASLGGMTAITLADLAPERVAGIALIDVGHRLEPEGVRKIVDFMTAHESFASLDEAAAAIAEYLPQRRSPNVSTLSRNLRQRPDGRWEWKHDVGRRVRERQASGLETAHPADHLDEVMAGLDEAAARLRCPVLVLRGENSDVLSDEGADDLVRLVPDARLETVARAGHLAVGDNPRSTVALLTGFFDELAGAGGIS